MERYLFVMIVVPVALLFTGLGIFAWRRKKPMWFYSGSEVKPWQIRDIPAYNRANGIMWLAFSLVFWVSAGLSLRSVEAAGLVTAVGCLAGIPILVVVYQRIYKKYRA